MQARCSRPLASPSPPSRHQSANHPLSSRSPLFAAPEQFVEPAAPFAFDVYSLGLCFLRLAWPSLQEEAALIVLEEMSHHSAARRWLCTQGETP